MLTKREIFNDQSTRKVIMSENLKTGVTKLQLTMIRTYLGCTRGNSNQNQPLFRWVTSIVYYLIVCQISRSFEHLHGFSLTYKRNKVHIATNMIRKHKCSTICIFVSMYKSWLPNELEQYDLEPRSGGKTMTVPHLQLTNDKLRSVSPDPTTLG